MRDIPECLNRRYRALDQLIMDLTSGASSRSSEMECSRESKNDVGVKLLCDFWKILKENPDFNLTQAVQQRMGIAAASRRCSHPQRVTCYMAGNEKQDEGADKKGMNQDCGGTEAVTSPKCCASKSVSPSVGSDVLPLSKVLCNLKEAASFDKKCNARINDLMLTQKELKDQIQHLELREKEGTQLLKQADCMWSCMEDTYKKKIADSLDRQKDLLKQLKEVEASATKWRKNKKDLDLQMDSINRCQQEIKEKTNQKTNDIKRMDMEIADFNKRIENNKKDTEGTKRSIGTKKQASNAKIAKLASELLKQQKILTEVNTQKQLKEKEGSKYVKEAREELQKICTVLLERKLKNEDLKAEKEALNVEIEFLRQTCDKCMEKCKNKQQFINDEIKAVEKEIGEFKIKCIRCHQCTDTVDVRKLCTDCPRCAEERDCLYEKDHCSHDLSMDCVCMSVKQKLLDNVFDNMYTVLERQTKTNPGKYVAEAVLNCLKRSRNGKLDDETRKTLQEFILTTVKKNLNLTIIGGAVKTRCEMDPETYKQLMLCLKQVKTVRPPKEDKGTAAKKESCRRWGGSSECNCPKGPKSCVCTQKAPPPPHDPTPCPPPEKEDAVEIIACPHKESVACGPDCAMHAVPSRIGADISSWRPAPCKESSCAFTNNMRAARCVVDPESVCSLPKGFASSIPYVSDLSNYNDMVICKCGSSPTKPCVCRDVKHLKAAISNQTDKETNVDTHNVVSTRDVPQDVLYVEKKRNKGSYDECISKEQRKLKNIASKPYDIFSDQKIISNPNMATKSHNSSASIVIDHKDLGRDKRNDHLLTASDSANVQLNNQFIELTSTASGNLAIELDEETIKIIENKFQEDPRICISLKKTNSGRYYFNFNRDSKTLMKNQKITLKKTLSGTKVFEIDKNLINELNTQNKKNSALNFTPINAHDCIEISKDFKSVHPLRNSAIIPQSINSVGNLRENKVNLIDLTYLCCSKDVPLKVLGRNGMCKVIRAPVTRTLSGNIAINIKHILSFGEISFIDKECPVILEKTSSKELLLDINKKDKPNATLRRTISGGIILLSIKPVLTLADIINNVREKNTLFKLKIKDIKNNLKEPPAVLHVTPSNNYIIVLDKEYEKAYIQTINYYIGKDNNECLVGLHRSASDNYIITLGDMDQVVTEQKALLVKSQSGYLKILVNSPIFDAMDQGILRKTSTLSVKAYGRLLETLSHSKKGLSVNRSLKNKLHHAKSSSDSNLYNKDKIKLTDQQSLTAKPSATLKRTASGHYAVILNKATKKAFVTNLKNYLRGSQGLIPIKRTESGEITIILNSEDESKIGYGSLKITRSGNIYVVVDEKVIQDPSKRTDTNNDDIRSKHMIGQVKQPVNKSITTTCNANPSSSFCNSCKCVCNKLEETQRWLQNITIKDSLRVFQPENCNMDWKKRQRNKDNGQMVSNPEKYAKNIDKSPHIVIKPCECRPIIMKNPKSKECYFMVDSICPFHVDRYDDVSNELLEISGLCSKTRDASSDDEVHGDYKKDEDHWDSLSYLPPQLPAFLNGYKYR